MVSHRVFVFRQRRQPAGNDDKVKVLSPFGSALTSPGLRDACRYGRDAGASGHLNLERSYLRHAQLTIERYLLG